MLKFCIKSKYKWGTQEHNGSLTILYLASECYQVQSRHCHRPVQCQGDPDRPSPLSIYKWDRRISRSLPHIHTEIPESRILFLIKMKSQLFSRNSLGTCARPAMPPPLSAFSCHILTSSFLPGLGHGKPLPECRPTGNLPPKVIDNNTNSQHFPFISDNEPIIWAGCILCILTCVKCDNDGGWWWWWWERWWSSSAIKNISICIKQTLQR